MTEHCRQAEVQRLRDLIDVAQTVVSSLDLDQALQQVLQHARELVAVPAGSIALYCAESSTMSLHAAEGLSAAFVARNRWQVEEGGLTQTILEQNRLFVVEDTSQAVYFNNPLAIAEGIRSLIAVPLKIQQKIVGILYLNDFVSRNYPEEQLELLTIMASFAALSIENARLHEQTKRLASTDGLTELYNHRQFKRMLEQEFIRAQRYTSPLSLVMFDVDDFKQFNDRYGHPCGDRILIDVAKLLRQAFREADLVFRYGGEEFIAILPGATLKQALVAAERARRIIAGARVDCPDVGAELGVTVSVGVATYPQDGATPDQLLNAVDALLYRAKREGKNRVYFAGSDQAAS